MPLGRPKQFKHLHRCNGHFHRVRLRQSNILTSHAHQPPRDVQRILARFNHPRQPIQRRIRIRIAHRLVQRRNQIEMFFARLVIRQQLPLQHILQPLLRQHPPPLRTRFRPHHQRFQSVVSRPRISIRQNRNPMQYLQIRRHIFFPQPARRILQRPLQQRNNLLRRVRPQHIHLHPRKQRRNHLERRILRRRANQQNVSRLHVRQKSILLRAIEPVHFIHKHNRPPPIPPRSLRLGHHFLNLFNSGKHRTEWNELRLRGPRNNPRQSSLPAPRRPPQEHRTQIVALNLHPQRFPRPQQFLLPNKLIQSLRTHPVSQRPPRRRFFLRLHSLKKSHAQISDRPSFSFKRPFLNFHLPSSAFIS